MSGFGLLSVAVRITAAVLVTLLMLVLLVVPSVLLGDSLVSGARSIVDSFQRGELHIPPHPTALLRGRSLVSRSQNPGHSHPKTWSKRYAKRARYLRALGAGY
jgi:predicted PurR-regulated permease PerM